MAAFALRYGATPQSLPRHQQAAWRAGGLLRRWTLGSIALTDAASAEGPMAIGSNGHAARNLEASNDHQWAATNAQPIADKRTVRLSCAEVRSLVDVQHRSGLEVANLSTHDACAAAEALGWNPGGLKGDKVVASIKGRRSGEIVAVAIGARPRITRLDDALTLELRCFVVDEGQPEAGEQLLRAIASASSERGYRRLVVLGSHESPGHPALDGWQRVRGLRDRRVDGRQMAIWGCVLLGDGRIR